LADEVTN